MSKIPCGLMIWATKSIVKVQIINMRETGPMGLSDREQGGLTWPTSLKPWNKEFLHVHTANIGNPPAESLL